jgi:hypothetical protein
VFIHRKRTDMPPFWLWVLAGGLAIGVLVWMTN